jgi:hypothetical protein
LEEKYVRINLKSALERTRQCKGGKEGFRIIIEIKISEKNGEMKALKAALRRKDISSDEKKQATSESHYFKPSFPNKKNTLKH